MSRLSSSSIPSLCFTIVIISRLANISLAAFSSSAPSIFQPEMSLNVPSKVEGVDIELPNFDVLFDRIHQVSPLARAAMEGKEGGFANISDNNGRSALKWRVLESNKNRIVHQIEKIDNFQGIGHPLLRFRSSLKGPCVPELFARMIMDYDARSQWDAQIADVYEIYPALDLETVKRFIDGKKYGECSRLGIGYCQTKPNFVVSSREQLTLCGVQDFKDQGSSIIWGVEMPETYDRFLPDPKDQGHVRAKSHLFSTTLIPTGPDSFDAEYVLQLEIGGAIPNFLTTPILQDTVKGLFHYAKDFFEKEESLYVDGAKVVDRHNKVKHAEANNERKTLERVSSRGNYVE